EQLGEIVGKRETNAPSVVEEYIGYTPTWEAVERVFNEYRRAERRTAHNVGRKLVYDDASDPEDQQRFKHPLHFIDGYVLVGKDGYPIHEVSGTREALHPKEGERCVALRDLSLRDWLTATSIMADIQHAIHNRAQKQNRRAQRDFDAGAKHPVTFIRR